MDDLRKKLEELTESITLKERELRTLRKSLDALWEEVEGMIQASENQVEEPVKTASIEPAAPAIEQPFVQATPIEEPDTDTPSFQQEDERVDSEKEANTVEPIEEFHPEVEEEKNEEPPTEDEPVAPAHEPALVESMGIEQSAEIEEPAIEAANEPEPAEETTEPVAAAEISEAKEIATPKEIPIEEKELIESIEKESAALMVDERPTVMDHMEDKVTVGDMAGQVKVKDLKKAMGINERFLFANELFGGDMSAFTQAVQELNHISSSADANRMMNEQLAKRFHWDEASEVTESFRSLVSRRFVG